MSHVAAEGPFREDQQTGPAVARMADQLGDASEADVDVIVERRGSGGDPERSHSRISQLEDVEANVPAYKPSAQCIAHRFSRGDLARDVGQLVVGEAER